MVYANIVVNIYTNVFDIIYQYQPSTDVPLHYIVNNKSGWSFRYTILIIDEFL